jgi:hypothetical protein
MTSNSVPMEARYAHAGQFLGIRSRQIAEFVLLTIGFVVSQSRLFSESKRMQSSSEKPSGVGLCLMRLAFIVMFIMLITLTVLTGVYYAADLSLQASCRMVNDDQPFLVSFILSEPLLECLATQC